MQKKIGSMDGGITMYIKHIKIKNYRCFSNFEMSFHDGLNVIVGSNNSGKTGLLRAIAMLSNPDNIEIDDFNKNDLQKHFADQYKTVPPDIVIEYEIKHTISEKDTDDESIIKLLSFIGMDKIEESKKTTGSALVYTLTACVKMTYSLNSKEIGRYADTVSTVTSFEEYYNVLSLFQKYYSWSFTNGRSDTTVDKKEATDIFQIDFIEAERNSEEVYRETKHEIEIFLKSDENSAALQELQHDLSDAMKNRIQPVLSRISTLIDNEQNDIGLKKGNIAISQDLRPSASISNSYVIDVRDTKSDYVLPLSHNGLGYNNLINMYMLIRLVEIKRGKDFRILCLEEPEAHLHPAMQYKLFKFLKKLDAEDKLNQQIFVTTHSSNITAVAGLDNMFMLAYERADETSDCVQQSMQKQLEHANSAKDHMMKFLDVTRSDILFADKIILVEGIAEKLLLPKFMEKCGYSYEDEHVSIIEIGGKHFDYFIRLFAHNPVKKKVLCITDNDFKWEENGVIADITTYANFSPSHVKKLNEDFVSVDNLHICYQNQYGKTFEDELFISNFDQLYITKKLLKIALPDSLHTYIEENGTNFYRWWSNINTVNAKSREKIKKPLMQYVAACKAQPANIAAYKMLFFAELFYLYAQDRKGDVALSILVDDALMKKMVVPSYIKEGIKWLSK